MELSLCTKWSGATERSPKIFSRSRCAIVNYLAPNQKKKDTSKKLKPLGLSPLLYIKGQNILEVSTSKIFVSFIWYHKLEILIAIVWQNTVMIGLIYTLDVIQINGLTSQQPKELERIRRPSMITPCKASQEKQTRRDENGEHLRLQRLYIWDMGSAWAIFHPNSKAERKDSEPRHFFSAIQSFKRLYLASKKTFIERCWFEYPISVPHIVAY